MGLRGVALDLVQLGLQPLDVGGQLLLGRIVLGLLGLVGLDFRIDGGFLLGVAGLDLCDGGLQLGLPGLEVSVLALQLGQLGPLGIDGPPEHQHFQHFKVSFR